MNSLHGKYEKYGQGSRNVFEADGVPTYGLLHTIDIPVVQGTRFENREKKPVLSRKILKGSDTE